MFSIRKIWWTLTVLLISLYIPSKGHAIITIHASQYERTTLTGRVTFQYSQSRRNNKGGSKSESSNFNQHYSLNMNGNLLNPLLFIYETGIEYGQQDTNLRDSKSEKHFYSYRLKTYILAESIVPLTLHGRRTVTGDSTSDSYGLNWRGKFRTLPKTNIDILRSVTAIWQTTDYKLNLQKNLTNSKNEFDYTLSERELQKTAEKSSIMAMNFSNQTRISRSTGITFNGAKGVSEAASGAKSHAEGLSVGLHSSPSKSFNQSHGYYYTNSEGADSQQTTEGYTGNISYGFSDNLSSSMGLVVSSTEADSLTSRRETDVLSTNGSLSYRASEKLSLSESISYTKVDLLGSVSGQDNMSDKTRLRVRSSAHYHTLLDWASLGTSYSLGYVEETRTGEISPTQRDRGTAIEQNVSLSLADMNAWEYATVNASSGYGYSEPLEGDYSNRDFNFSTSATNKVWKEQIDLHALYTKTINRSWLSANDSESDRLSLRGRSLYLTQYFNPDGNGRTSFGFTASRMSRSDNFDDKRTNTSGQIALQHNREIYYGMLTGSFDYSTSQSRSSNNTSKSSYVNLNASYERMLLRRILWKAKSTNRMEKKTSYRRYESSITNDFRYRLRFWSLGAEHQFSWRKQSRSSSTAHRIMFTASRNFIRVF